MENTRISILEKIKRTCKNRKGVSLAETLAGFLIIVLMLTSLASTIILAANLKMKTDRQRSDHAMLVNAYWNYKASGDLGEEITQTKMAWSQTASNALGTVHLEGYLNSYETKDGAKIYELTGLDS